jgi:hypothetical protein
VSYAGAESGFIAFLLFHHLSPELMIILHSKWLGYEKDEKDIDLDWRHHPDDRFLYVLLELL